MRPMSAQPGIFALGTAVQCYLEFDQLPEVSRREFVTALASLEEPGASIGGVNLVVGFAPELWAELAGDAAPREVRSFIEPVSGPDGFTMPATQHDGWLWISGASQDIVFDVATRQIELLADVARVASEVTGWPYQRIRDLTGFIDGTENPPLAEAATVALVGAGQPGADSSVVLVQQWRHQGAAWHALLPERQEQVIGRTKPDSVELTDLPADSHVARTVVAEGDVELEIFRRNTPYGGVTEHGTMFVGFCARQDVLHRMLEQMAGVGDGVRDALTRFTEPLTGAYYVVPSVEALGGFRLPPPSLVNSRSS
jgi:putative iron-dependent peroxidase